jgi:hypothetical protein
MEQSTFPPETDIGVNRRSNAVAANARDLHTPLVPSNWHLACPRRCTTFIWSNDMAHPDPNRQGSEKDQRRHVGNNSEASDTGVQDKSQGKSGAASPKPKDDPSLAPESGEKLDTNKGT